MNVKIVAEGVELESEVEKLKELQRDHLQGYLFSKPICEEAYVDLLKGIK